MLGLKNNKGGGILSSTGLESITEDGEKLAGEGFFPTTITLAQMSGRLSNGDVTPDTGQWYDLTYYVVGDQETAVLGSKEKESDEIGEVNIQLRDSNDNTVTDTRVRVGYETKNGRASYPIFNHPSERLDQTDVEDRLQQAPKRWPYMSDNTKRQGRAVSQDRLFCTVYQETAATIDKANTRIEFPVMLSEE